MDILSIIEKKKRGGELTSKEIHYWIKHYCKDEIPDYQVSALLMAIRLKGMTKQEIFDLTEAMMHSGEIIDLSKIEGVKCDKHSTGGDGLRALPLGVYERLLLYRGLPRLRLRPRRRPA